MLTLQHVRRKLIYPERTVDLVSKSLIEYLELPNDLSLLFGLSGRQLLDNLALLLLSLLTLGFLCVIPANDRLAHLLDLFIFKLLRHRRLHPINLSAITLSRN